MKASIVSSTVYWIYKCNSQRRPYQVVWGDWANFFAEGKPSEWGSTEWVAQLVQARPGDMVLAYQTDRNELVGLAKVVRQRPRGEHLDLILKPLELIGAKVRLLKATDPRIADIPALKPGPVRTLYKISPSDARRLLKSARKQVRSNPEEDSTEADTTFKGAGFGAPEENRRVEVAAVDTAKSWYTKRGWRVTDVSSKNVGYDLLCTRQGKRRHVEVKGARHNAQRFIITRHELSTLVDDPDYQIALVTNALLAQPTVKFYSGLATLRSFALTPVSYVATLK